MTRKGTTRHVGAAFADDRLRIARAYLKAAREGVAALGKADIANPAISQIVHAAIAFADALTASYARVVNQRDHAAAVKTLRDALGNRLPLARETDLRRILGEKDEIQYGTRASRPEDAVSLLTRLEAFAAWAEAEIARPR